MNTRDICINLTAIGCLASIAWYSKDEDFPLQKNKTIISCSSRIENGSDFCHSAQELFTTPFKLPTGQYLLQGPEVHLDLGINKKHSGQTSDRPKTTTFDFLATTALAVEVADTFKF